MPEILVIEFLHAHSAAFEQASGSLRSEGRQMLVSAVNDFLSVPGLSVSIAVCAAAAATLESALAESVQRLRVPDSSDDSSTIAAISALTESHFQYVFPIAPECDGILSALVATLIETLASTNACLLTTPLAAIKICSDKWTTHQFLTDNRLPTIPTYLVDQLREDLFAINQQVVVKPRDGAGSENIQAVVWGELYSRWSDSVTSNSRPASQLPTDRQLVPESWWQHFSAEHPHSASSFVVQPYIAAESLSIGVIGRGPNTSPLILPVATQTICWQNGQPCYQGGQIPASVSAKVADEASQLASRIAQLLQINHGYIGIDLLLPQDSDQLLITEINPRLCSSYIGYRQATTANLAEILLAKAEPHNVTWIHEVVSFNVTG